MKRKIRTKRDMAEKKQVAKATSRDEKIGRGELVLSELETLRLQKLFHQNASAAEKAARVSRDLNDAQRAAVESATLFNQQLDSIREAYGLEPYHDVILDDKRPGVIVVDQQLKQQHEAKLAAEEKAQQDALNLEKELASREKTGVAGSAPEPAAEEPATGQEGNAPKQV